MKHRHAHRPTSQRFTGRSSPSRFDNEPELPVAGVDRIEDAATALMLVDALASDPRSHQTLIVLLDDEHRGFSIVNIPSTVDNDSVLYAADHMAGVAHHLDEIGAVIIASFRPGGSDELDDVERWLTIDEQLNAVGVELIEWFVIGTSVSCPRALLGDAPRWAA